MCAPCALHRPWPLRLQVIVGAAFLSGLIGLVSSYFRNCDFEEESLKSQLDYLYHYMQHRKLPRELQQRISSYYLLVWSNPRVSQVCPCSSRVSSCICSTLHLMVLHNSFPATCDRLQTAGRQAATFHAALPPFIQRDLRIFMHQHMARSISALKQIGFFSLKAICINLRTNVALTGDRVCEAGEPAELLHFVDFGSLVVLPNVDGNCTSGQSRTKQPERRFLLTSGDHFGSEMLYCNSPNAPIRYETSVDAISNCHLFYLTLKVSAA